MKPTDFSRRMGENLKHQRTLMGLSAAELSEKIGLSVDSVYKMERGEVSMSIELKHKCARILGCNPQTFEDGLDLDEGETLPPLKHVIRQTDKTVRKILRKLSSEWDGDIKALVIYMGMIAALPPEERREIYMQGVIVRDRLLADGKIKREDLPDGMDYMEEQLGGLYDL